MATINNRLTKIPAVTELISTVRDSLGDALRTRVIGPNGDARAQELMDTPGPRWFDEDRPVRRVHSDASMFIGGLRSLMVQTLHPLAMAGVANHSNYKTDPWGRLQRTADFLAATTFGPADEAQAIIDRIKHVHGFVKGTASDGRPYSANDPHLLRWVHVVEVDSFLTSHQRYGKEPLDQAGRDGYVADMALIAAKLDVPNPPTTEKELSEQLLSFHDELKSTAESRDALKYLMFQPPLPIPARAAYYALVAATAATLPAWSRPMLRIPYLPLTERFALRPLGSGITSAFRWITEPTSPYQQAQAARAAKANS